jgi:hypothetical protein
MKFRLFTVIMLLVAICFPFVVNAADLTPAYLAGTWLLGDTAQDCKDPDTEPGFFKDVMKEAQVFQGQYYYFHGRMITFDLTDKSFKAVGLLGDEYAKTIAVRCQ